MSADDKQTDNLTSDHKPKLSVLMASYNSKKYLDTAVKSVIAQTLYNFELIIVDDASTDDTPALIQSICAADSRVSFVPLKQNGGPAVAWNAALNRIKGDWFAIVDSDDIIHPKRFEYLISKAETDAVDIAADNLLIFSENQKFIAAPHLDILSPKLIDAVAFTKNHNKYGYLKPIFRAAKFRHLRYNEDRLPTDDFDFSLRCLCSSNNLKIYPDIMYFYRQHGQSISKRRTKNPLDQIAKADRKFRDEFSPPHELLEACRMRMTDIEKRLNALFLVESIKRADWRDAMTFAFARRQSLRYLSLPITRRLYFPGLLRACRARASVKSAISEGFLDAEFFRAVIPMSAQYLDTVV